MLAPTLVTACTALLACICAAVSAQQVTLSGVMGSKALLVIDGGAPKAVGPGETYKEVKLISVNGDQAVLEIKGQRHTQRVGDAPTSVGASTRSSEGKTIVLQAVSGGHFVTPGRINNEAVQFLVDTGATMVAMGQQDAERIRLNYRQGELFRANTANGTVTGWRVKLNSIMIGDVTIYDVEAAVIPGSMPHILLGNSYLSRFQMRRENEQMTLVKRF